MEVLFEAPPSMAFVRATTDVSLSKDPEQEISNRIGSGFGAVGSGNSPDEASSGSSSSIGVPDDDSEDGGDVEVQSELKSGGFCSLDSLEDSLPIKRGLSSHFSGKSKSFTNLAEVAQVKDLVKPENPFNKRRRIFMTSKWSRKSSFYNWPNPKSMPLLALNEEEEEVEEAAAKDHLNSEEKETESDEDDELRRRGRKFLDRKLHSLKSRSCFDLQEYQQL